MMNHLPEWLLDLDFPLDSKMGFEMHELTAERVVGSIPVQGNTQPFGLLHGGASAVLVETLASMGAVVHGRPRNKLAVGVDLNVTHIRAAREGRVTGVATALHLGSRTAVYQVEITDDQGRRTAIGRLTCQLIPAPDTAANGSGRGDASAGGDGSAGWDGSAGGDGSGDGGASG